MADVKPTELQLLPESFGLPADTPPDAFVKHLLSLQGKSDRVEKVLAEKENLLQKAEDGAKAIERLKEAEAELFIQRAVDNLWIEAHRKPFYMKLWKVDEASVREDIESQRFNSFLKRADRIKGGDANSPKDAIEEVTTRVSALRKGDKSLSEAAAQKMVFDENPKLYDAYRASLAQGGAN